MIIRSKYENDVYQWNISYFLMLKFPRMRMRFKFMNRTPGEKVDKKFLEDFGMEMVKLRNLKGTEEMKMAAARKLWWISLWYHDWYQNADIFRPEAIKPWIDENDEFQCYAEDYGWRVVFWETNVLPIYTELRNRLYGYTQDKINEAESLEKLVDQIELSNAHQLPFAEFGLRRRFSANWQDRVDDIIKERAKYCLGNSSVYQAIRLDQPAIGTQAHSIYMAYNGVYGYRQGSYMCVKDWMEVFNGYSGILLGDTIGIDAFLGQMPALYLMSSSGYRHDSGPWEQATSKYIHKLQECRIDPRTKRMTYSDSIDMYKLDDIGNNVRGRLGSFNGGIGGALTNNTTIPEANPKIVMKLDAIQLDENSPWISTIKNPDSEGKAMGNPKEIEYCNFAKKDIKIW